MPSRYMILGVVLLGLALLRGGVLFMQPRRLVALLARGSGDVLFFVDGAESAIALTIDDGPDGVTTPRILEVLARQRARATFFLISSRVPGHEGLISRMVAQGHELGNHLTLDEPSIRLSAAGFESALVEADSVLSRFRPMRWLRPGSGWYSDTMLAIARARGYDCALGSIYPYDALIPWPRFAALQILTNARAGDVIVLHDGGARGRRTAAVLERILPALQRRGLEVVTPSDLAGRLRRGPSQISGDRHRSWSGPGRGPPAPPNPARRGRSRPRHDPRLLTSAPAPETPTMPQSSL
ncbi:MAG: polysaccharide deacetylase family protein [Gemmatimonadales bacterium]